MVGQKKYWKIKKPQADTVQTLEEKYHLSNWLARILANRGTQDIADIYAFLSPDIQKLIDPFQFQDMDKATNRIISAITKKETIVVFGDYDVDGITSTSVLYHFLNRFTNNITYFIPSRDKHGYGLTFAAIEDLLMEVNPNLIITVDCGINSCDEVEKLQNQGIDVIITDHHEIGILLPPAFTVIHPQRIDKSLQYQCFAGVGVVFKLLMALSQSLGLQDAYLEYIDIVSIGTIADVVPLTGENRIIVSMGIEKLRNTKCLGLACLMEASMQKSVSINARSVAFTIAPRINAAGRIGDPKDAIKLIIEKDFQEAKRLSQKLCDLNRERQEIEAGILSFVLIKIEQENLNLDSILVVEGDGWHHGVLGIVASRVVEKFSKPCIIISFDENGIGRGSARSIVGFNIYHAILACESYLERYGGHEQAGGVTVKKERYQDFKKTIIQYTKQIMHTLMLRPGIMIDLEVEDIDLTMENILELRMLAPFGEGNPEPVFLLRHLVIREARLVGEGKHISFSFKTANNGIVNGISFQMGDRINEFCFGQKVDVVFTLDINEWKGQKSISLVIKDINIEVESLLRTHFYHQLEKCINRDTLHLDKTVTALSVGKESNVSKENLLMKMHSYSNNNNSMALLVSDLDSFKLALNLLEEYSSINATTYFYDFSGCEVVRAKNIDIIIMPKVETDVLSRYDCLVFVGSWFIKSYLDKLILKLGDKEIAFYHFNQNSAMNWNWIVPHREDIGHVFKKIKSSKTCEFQLDQRTMHVFAEELGKSADIHMNYFKIKKCLEILEEIGIVNITQSDEKVHIKLCLQEGEKKDLNTSILYQDLTSLKDHLGSIQ